MSASSDSRSAAERVDDIDLILAEMSAAVREVLAQHKRDGYPIAIWQDGRVVWIPADQISEEDLRPPPADVVTGTRGKDGQPSVLATSISLVDDEAARAFVDQTIGPAQDWHSPLLAYRLQQPDQNDWKAEVGNVLLFAQQHGFLGPLVDLLKNQANKAGFSADPDPPAMTDRGHLKFHHVVAEAIFAYYLSRTGWSLETWQPSDLPGDVDVLMRSPSAESVALQIKASGRVGSALLDNRKPGWTPMSEVVEGIANAQKQLLVSQPTLIGVFPQTAEDPVFHPREVLAALYGRTIQEEDGAVYLPRENRGCFFDETWNNVGAVCLLSFVRALDRNQQTYASTVLINPNARSSQRCSPQWFPYSRVLVLEHERFQWLNGEPAERRLPSGTILVR
jgi:hypothetical protein